MTRERQCAECSGNVFQTPFHLASDARRVDANAACPDTDLARAWIKGAQKIIRLPVCIFYEQANIFSNFSEEGFDSALYNQLMILPWLGNEIFLFL